MQLISNTISTTTDELRELMQFCILHDIEGPVNITFANNQIDVWQPENMPIAESVRRVQRFPAPDEDRNHLCEYAV